MRRQKIALWLLVAMMSISVLPAMAQDGDAAALNEIPEAYKLDTNRLFHFAQTWNNCGGATTSMALTYYGFQPTHNSEQEGARKYLKPNWEDQNVSPWQIVDYVNEVDGPIYGVKAIARRGGSLELLQALLAADVTVMIEKGYEENDLDWMGHYLLLVGYDQTQNIFYSYDSFLGSNKGDGREEPYDKVEYYWRHFNNTYIVIYPQAREAEVQTILGEDWDERVGWERAKAAAQAEAAADPSDHWAWFNLGEAANALGEYDIAAVAFRQALDTGNMPWRTMWYLHGAFEAFYQTGQFKTVNELAWILQEITPYIEEANYYRGLVAAAQGADQDAIFRFDRVLEFNPNFYPALEAKQQILDGTFVGPEQTDA